MDNIYIYTVIQIIHQQSFNVLFFHLILRKTIFDLFAFSYGIQTYLLERKEFAMGA